MNLSEKKPAKRGLRSIAAFLAPALVGLVVVGAVISWKQELFVTRTPIYIFTDSALGITKGPNQEGAGGGPGGGVGVNAYLWRAALDTLSFMPLSSADPFGGVIITDWYNPPQLPGERYKATAYILGRSLRSDGVRVNIFHQVMQNGQWVDVPVSASTVGEMENKVLARARQLREQSSIRS